MAAGYLAWDLWILEERYRTQESRVRTRTLRDATNMFELPNKAFVSHFRLPKDLVREIVDCLRPRLIRNSAAGLSPEVQVLVALHFYSTGSYQRPVGALLPVSQASVSRCVHSVTKGINDILLQKWIKFPITGVERRLARDKFLLKSRPFPGAIGALDCTHIQIIAPKDHEEAFINHKGSHSLNVMAICDPDLMVLDVVSQWPGARHDSFIWAQSSARAAMEIWFAKGERDTFLLDDSGFPLEPWLMTPIMHTQPGTQEHAYTQEHIINRNPVERLFGVIKNVFRCLHGHRVLHYEPAFAGMIANACFVLHNMRVRSGMIYEGINQTSVAPPSLPLESNQVLDDGVVSSQGRLRTAARAIQQRIVGTFPGI